MSEEENNEQAGKADEEEKMTGAEAMGQSISSAVFPRYTGVERRKNVGSYSGEERRFSRAPS